MYNKTISKELRIVRYTVEDQEEEYYIEIDANSLYSTIVKIDKYKFEELKNTYNLIEKVINTKNEIP
jgi:hypothetical protein